MAKRLSFRTKQYPGVDCPKSQQSAMGLGQYDSPLTCGHHIKKFYFIPYGPDRYYQGRCNKT